MKEAGVAVADHVHRSGKGKAAALRGILALVLGSCVIGLLLAEGLLRLFDYSRPPLYQYSYATGADHRPNSAGWYEQEDLVYVTINSDGLRGPEVPREKADNVYRIAVLGDSFAEAFQVAYEERFSRVAEVALEGCAPPGRRIEVINFGVAGYGTAREIMMLRDKAVHYDPDLVFLLFTPVNDLRNNHPLLEDYPLIPYYTLVDGGLVFDDSFRRDPEFLHKLTWSNRRNDVVSYSRVLQVLQDAYVHSRLRFGDARADTGMSALDANRSLTYHPPREPLALEAWAVTEAMLGLLRDETAAAGMDLWLSVVPPSGSVIADPVARRAAMTDMGLDTPDYVEDRLRGLAAEQGIDFISVTEALRRHTETTGVDVDYFEHIGGRGGHWNGAAHRVVGETMAAALCQALGSD